MLNEDISYLLGMVVGKGKVIRSNSNTKIIIDIPHKNLKIEGEDTQLSIKSSLLDIVDRLNPLVGNNLKWNTMSKNVAHLFFSKPNGDYLIRTIIKYLGNKTNWKRFRIPKEIFESSRDIKSEFLRGIADVTAHIRNSNKAYGKDYSHRVYVEIMTNWDLCVDIANLLKNLDIPVQNIRFAHPNMVDPRLKEYNKGNKEFWNKEHQIKIYAEEFEKIGFNIEHKNNLLQKFAELNREKWREKEKKSKRKEINPIEKNHHRYYWEVRSNSRKKPKHPEENSSKLPEKVRKHFDSWSEIAEELGYHE